MQISTAGHHEYRFRSSPVLLAFTTVSALGLFAFMPVLGYGSEHPSGALAGGSACGIIGIALVGAWASRVTTVDDGLIVQNVVRRWCIPRTEIEEIEANNGLTIRLRDGSKVDVGAFPKANINFVTGNWRAKQAQKSLNEWLALKIVRKQYSRVQFSINVRPLIAMGLIELTFIGISLTSYVAGR